MSNDAKYIAFVKQIPEEQEYFMKYARRFDTNLLDKRYGILIMNCTPLKENMLYAPDPKELHSKHIDYLIEHPELVRTTISNFKHFLNWLEGIEGKKPRIDSPFII